MKGWWEAAQRKVLDLVSTHSGQLSPVTLTLPPHLSIPEKGGDQNSIGVGCRQGFKSSCQAQSLSVSLYPGHREMNFLPPCPSKSLGTL